MLWKIDVLFLKAAHAAVMAAARMGVDKRTFLRELAAAMIVCFVLVLVITIIVEGPIALMIAPILGLTIARDARRWRKENSHAGHLETQAEIEAEMARSGKAVAVHATHAGLVVAGNLLHSMVLLTAFWLTPATAATNVIFMLFIAAMGIDILYHYGQMIPPVPPRRRQAAPSGMASDFA